MILLWPSRQSSFGATFTVVENIVAASMLGRAALILIGTKVEHPGSVGLLGIAVLVWFGDTT
ncbi:hypothetical protein [Brevibacillus brevis]|uniref:hypothetical protein n=1 Tax=Brevibacillus brevis TaxID=1393 RepID=UPI002570B465|nr:hypothetical protein [Lysinibacillus sp. SDF0063]